MKTLSPALPPLLRLRRLLPALAALALLLPLPAAQAAEDFSPAERALFVTNQLARLKPPVKLHYSYSKQGTLEAGFDDSVDIHLRRGAEGQCCAATADFLHGERQLKLPEIDSAQGNPAIMYFLERDIAEMQRLTKGQKNYFRKRIRMAVFQGAVLRAVQVAWDGKTVDGQEIQITPYLDDPLRQRFEQLATKQYLFTLSDAVPGGLLSIRTRVAGASPGAAPLLAEEMLLQRLEPLADNDKAAKAAKPAKTLARRQP